MWRESLLDELLARTRERTLYVSGTVSNQGRFYERLDAVVLLSAPRDVLLDRIAARTTNPYGKRADERAAIVRQLVEIDPLLRVTCTHEIDATQPIATVVEQVLAIGDNVAT